MIEKGRNNTFLLGAVAIVVGAIAVGWFAGRFRRATPAQTAESPSTASPRAEMLFQANCANCHGPDGAGDGPAAMTMRPPPRDFAARPWRFEISKDSIARVIRDGLPGTAMPAGKANFSEADIGLLTEHVLRLAASRPIVRYEQPAEERLLTTANLIPLYAAQIPALVLENSKGETLRLADLKGKVVLLHFWGTACEHCLKEMPALRKLETEGAARGLRVLHVCTDSDDAKEAQSLLNQFDPGLHAWIDANGIGLARFDVKVLPTVWVIDAEGRALARGQGARDWNATPVRKLFEHLLSHP